MSIVAKGKKKNIEIETPESMPEEMAAESAEGISPEMKTEENAADAETEKTDADSPEESTAEEEAAEDPENAETTEETGSETGEKKVGGFFKKKTKKDEQIEELTDRLQRQMAEFENFRRRSDKEKTGMYDMGVRDVAEKLLPVIDNFERGLASAEEGDAFAEGMKMIYKQLMTMLADIGVEPMDAAGKEFDPNLHNAVMHIDDDSLGENIVAEELQKGYMYKDHVVRHSMVKVAN